MLLKDKVAFDAQHRLGHRAEAAVFLASDKTSYITNTIMRAPECDEQR